MKAQVLLAVLLLMVPVLAAETLKVGVYDNPPKVYVDEDGNPDGFWVDIVDYMAAQEGWEIEYVECVWNDCLGMIEAGELDVFMDVAYSDARAEIYDYNEETVVLNWATVYVPMDSDIVSVIDLENKRVAVMEGGIHYIGPRGIKNTLESFDIDATYVEVGGYADVFVAIENGSADAGVVNRLFGVVRESEYTVEATTIILNPVQLMFIFPKGTGDSTLARVIDTHLAEMKTDPASVYHQSLHEHLGEAATEVEVFPEWAIWALLAFGVVLLLLAATAVILDERKELYRVLVDDSPLPVATLDPMGNFLSVNNAFEELFERKESEITSKNFGDFMTAGYLEIATAAFKKLVGGGAASLVEIVMEVSPGKKKSFEVQGAFLKKKNLVVGVFRDVTERKKEWERRAAKKPKKK
ncbi:transporter substrate-binding domain-containing protein [archaeon]